MRFSKPPEKKGRRVGRQRFRLVDRIRRSKCANCGQYGHWAETGADGEPKKCTNPPDQKSQKGLSTAQLAALVECGSRIEAGSESEESDGAPNRRGYHHASGGASSAVVMAAARHNLASMDLDSDSEVDEDEEELAEEPTVTYRIVIRASGFHYAGSAAGRFVGVTLGGHADLEGDGMPKLVEEPDSDAEILQLSLLRQEMEDFGDDAPDADEDRTMGNAAFLGVQGSLPWTLVDIGSAKEIIGPKALITLVEGLQRKGMRILVTGNKPGPCHGVGGHATPVAVLLVPRCFGTTRGVVEVTLYREDIPDITGAGFFDAFGVRDQSSGQYDRLH